VSDSPSDEGPGPSQVPVNRRIPFTGAELRTRLRNYDRYPFIELLAGFLECLPDEVAIMTFAKKYPDRYINALSQIARVAGYTDRTEVTHNMNLSITQMSDSQIEDKIREMTKTLNLPAPGSKAVGEAAIEDAEFEELKNPKI
jgi:hypothetical protein